MNQSLQCQVTSRLHVLSLLFCEKDPFHPSIRLAAILSHIFTLSSCMSMVDGLLVGHDALVLTDCPHCPGVVARFIDYYLSFAWVMWGPALTPPSRVHFLTLDGGMDA